MPSTTRLIPMFVPRPKHMNSNRACSARRSRISRDATELNSSVKPLRWSASLSTLSRSRTPQRRVISSLSACRVGGSGCFLIFGTVIHGSPWRSPIRTPPVVPAPLHAVPIIHDSLPPRRRHYAVDRDLVRGIVPALLPGPRHVAAQQIQGVHDRPILAVVRVERQGREQWRQQPAIVARVRGPQHRPDALPEGRIICLGLPHEVAQRRLAHDRIQRLAYRLLWLLQGCFSETEEYTFLAADALEIVGELLFHPILR